MWVIIILGVKFRGLNLKRVLFRRQLMNEMPFIPHTKEENDYVSYNWLPNKNGHLVLR